LGEALDALRRSIEIHRLVIVAVEANVEAMSLVANCVDAIVNTFILHRPFARQYPRALCPGGFVFFRTFTTGSRQIFQNMRPRTDFLLEPGELRRLFEDLEVVYYEEVERGGRAMATIVARPPGPKNSRRLAQSGGPGDLRATAEGGAKWFPDTDCARI
jgi:hypothetical protein